MNIKFSFHCAPFSAGFMPVEWFEVFMGTVRKVDYLKNKIIRQEYSDWRNNRHLVNELKKMNALYE